MFIYAGVSGVVYSLDGKMLVSAGVDGSILLWDVATGKTIGQPLTGHTDLVSSLAFSPDGSLLASGSGDGNIVLWDAATRRPAARLLTEHQGSINTIAFSPDGKLLAVGSCIQFDFANSACIRSEVRLWDVKNRTVYGQPFSEHTNFVVNIVFSPDSRAVISADWNGVIVRRDVVTGHLLQQIATGYGSHSRYIGLSPDGQTLEPMVRQREARGSASTTLGYGSKSFTPQVFYGYCGRK